MAVPSWDKFMIPCLEVLADGSTRQRREIVTLASNILQLTDADRSDLISSGGPRYVNRTNWAITYLNKAGAISSPARGHWSITEKGTELLHKHPQGLTEKALRLEGNENYLKFITPFPQCFGCPRSRYKPRIKFNSSRASRRWATAK